MAARDDRLAVALDLRRWAEALAYPRGHLGVDRYTRALYGGLCAREAELDLRPLVFARLDDPSFEDVRAATDALEAAVGRRVARSWRKRWGILCVLWALWKLEEAGSRLPALAGWSRARRLALHGRLFCPGPPAARRRWDLYHSTFSPLPPGDWTAGAVRVLTVHDCASARLPELSSDGGAVIREVLASVDPERDFVLCPSESTRRDVRELVRLPECQTRVIPLAADPLYAAADGEAALPLLRSLGVRPGGYVLLLGQYPARKNVLRAMQAFAESRRAGVGRDHVLLVVVERRHLKRIASFRAQSGLDESAARLALDVDDGTLAGLYADAAAFAYVSLYEGFGMPPLEAMHAGCPVVVANTTSLPEVVGNAGLYVDPRDVDSIAEGLTRVLTDEPLRRRMVSAGRKRAAGFSWDRTVAGTVEFYRHALAVSRPESARRVRAGRRRRVEVG